MRRSFRTPVVRPGDLDKSLAFVKLAVKKPDGSEAQAERFLKELLQLAEKHGFEPYAWSMNVNRPARVPKET